MRNILKVLLFFGGLGTILALLSFVFVPKNNTEAMGMQYAAANGVMGEKEDTIDVLILGDSEAFTSVSPLRLWDEYGFTAYNCGTSSQQLFDTLGYLDKALEKQNPKIVILETNILFREVNIGKMVGSWGKDLFPVIRYHNRWKQLSSLDFSKPDYTWSDGFKGFRYNTKIKKPKDIKNYMKYNKSTEEIKFINKKYIDKMLDVCIEHDIKLVFLSSPSMLNWSYKKHNAVSDYAKINNIEFIDLNLENIGINWNEDTRDLGDHLNYYGALKVTDYVGGYLSNLGILSNHKNDSRYSKWNQDYQNFVNYANSK